MSNKEKSLVRFNVQNVKYALMNDNGEYGEFKSIGTSTKLSIEVDSSEKKIYGDGKTLVHFINEKGKTATLTLNNLCDDYEVDMGRKMPVEGGLADVKPTKAVKHAIYFETCGIDKNNDMPIAKTIMYGVTSTRPAEDYEQTTDDINESTFDLPLAISGTPLLASDGSVFKDKYGNEVTVWQTTATPADTNYDTFGDMVTLPKKAAAAE